MTEDSDSKYAHELEEDVISFLKVGYDALGIVSISTINSIANLIYIVDIRSDSEFETICYMWEYQHKVE